MMLKKSKGKKIINEYFKEGLEYSFHLMNVERIELEMFRLNQNEFLFLNRVNSILLSLMIFYLIGISL